MNEFKRFEDKGLKLDKDRVLTYSQLQCPYGCRYCFAGDMDSNQQRNVEYLTKKQYELLFNLPSHINIIMLGCDTEFFQPSAKAIDVLNRLSNLDKNISVVTKMSLPDNIIKSISSIKMGIPLPFLNHYLAYSHLNNGSLKFPIQLKELIL